MNRKMARRELLKRLGLTCSGLTAGAFFQNSVLEMLLNQAWAQTNGGSALTSNYLHLNFPGAPPRWMFDLPLTPMGISPQTFVAGNFGTGFVSNAPFYQASRLSVSGRDVHLPPLWALPPAGINFAGLLENTIMIRGMDMEINSHNLSNARQVSPIIGGRSINGVVSDRSRLVVPGIVDGGNPASNAFRARSEVPATRVSNFPANVNLIERLLVPFKNYFADRTVHEVGQRSLQDQLLTQFDRLAEKNGTPGAVLNRLYNKTIEMIESDVFGLSNQWSAALAKYQGLVAQGWRPVKGQMPGFFDRPITVSTSPIFNYAQESRVGFTDLRDIIGDNSTILQMAEKFAMIEILSGRITNSMTMSFPGPSIDLVGGGRVAIGHDQHFVGSAVSTLTTTLFYRAFLSCLTELVAQFKSRGIFNQTLIHIAADFNRNPRADGLGSDHGVAASNTTIVSGMINQFALIGNIRVHHSQSTYPGTYGESSNYDLEGANRPIQVNDVARTITSMLATEDIVTNGRSLLTLDGQTWRPKKPEANNV